MTFKATITTIVMGDEIYRSVRAVLEWVIASTDVTTLAVYLSIVAYSVFRYVAQFTRVFRLEIRELTLTLRSERGDVRVTLDPDDPASVRNLSMVVANAVAGDPAKEK